MTRDAGDAAQLFPGAAVEPPMEPALEGPASDPEVALMLAFKCGEEEAFVKLYRAYRDRMVSFARRLLGDQARAEEAAQDVFLKLYQARASYTPRSRFSTFVFRVATNHCLNIRARKESQLVDAHLDAARRAGPAADEPDAEAARKRLQKALAAALSSLPENQGAALVLCHYEGLSYREAAEALDVTEAAVKSLVHRARSSLTQTLEPWLREMQGAQP